MRQRVTPQRPMTPGARRARLGLVCLALALVTTACSVPGVYVVEQDGATGAGSGANAKFDATTYADKNWASKVVPAATKDAVEATTLLPALQADRVGASKQYGKQAGSGAPYSFLIKGSGPVTAVSSGNDVGSIQIQVAGVGKTQVNLAVGPAFVGTAVRDAVGFIEFGQFTNQIDYADAATALNSKVKATVVNTLDLSTIKGKRVTFVGAFQLLDPSSVLITPITLQVGS
jgi:predicted lipoprotein